jgi:UDP-2,3-diacylglucosamine pyrophosphatase LpxH
MKKIKLVISDFHIGKGRFLEDGTINTLEDFIYDEKFIQFLDYYSQGEFEDCNVELIINGDFLNTLQVDYAEKFPEAITERIALEKVRQIFEGHPELFDAMKRFAQVPDHSITYISGNHDPVVHWQGVREFIEERLQANVKFPSFSCAFDGIYIEHGNQHAAANYFDPNRLFLSRGFPEPILNLPWGCLFVIKYLNRIKQKRPYVDKVRPFGRYLLAALFFDTGFATRAILRLALFFLSQQYVWLTYNRKRLVDVLRIFKEISIIPNLEGPARGIMKKERYHTVIMGHNHQAAFRRLGKNKLYVNTGTWNDIIHLEIANLGRQRRMTYAYIEYDGEGRPQTRLKIWKGTRLVEEDVIY